MRYIRIRHCTVSGSYRCLIAMFIVCNLIVIGVAQVVVTQQHTTQCTVQLPTYHNSHGALQGIYSAPARYVPAPVVDPNVQNGFFELFQYDPSHSRNATSAYPGLGDQLPPGLRQSDLEYIARICPKNAFFYSLSPQHVIARNLLQRYLAAQPTPAELLRVARIILKNHEINPKIWYFALMGAIMERPDMNGIAIAQPLDAMPDLFIPAPVLMEAIQRFRIHYEGSAISGAVIPQAPVAAPGQFYFENEAESRYQNISYGYTVPPVADAPKRLSGGRGVGKRGKRQKGLRGRRFRQRLEQVTPDQEIYASGSQHFEVIVAAESANPAEAKVSKNRSGEKLGGNKSSERRRKTTLKPQVSYGEIDPEEEKSEELLSLHQVAGNNTKNLRERILQRRHRRKRVRTKRQLYGLHLHHDGVRVPTMWLYKLIQYLSPRKLLLGECVLVNGTVGADNGPENKLWYYREDLGVNLFHGYGHLNYLLDVSIKL